MKPPLCAPTSATMVPVDAPRPRPLPGSCCLSCTSLCAHHMGSDGHLPLQESPQPFPSALSPSACGHSLATLSFLSHPHQSCIVCLQNIPGIRPLPPPRSRPPSALPRGSAVTLHRLPAPAWLLVFIFWGERGGLEQQAHTVSQPWRSEPEAKVSAGERPCGGSKGALFPASVPASGGHCPSQCPLARRIVPSLPLSSPLPLPRALVIRCRALIQRGPVWRPFT